MMHEGLLHRLQDGEVWNTPHVHGEQPELHSKVYVRGHNIGTTNKQEKIVTSVIEQQRLATPRFSSAADICQQQQHFIRSSFNNRANTTR